jgi:pyruvate kinase
MLSAESAVGKYPEKAVKTMSDICIQAEKDIDYKRNFFHSVFNTFDIQDVVSHSATNCSFKLNAKALTLYTTTGKTASMIARFKPETPIIAITDNFQTYNYLSLEWNVLPVYSKASNVDIFDLAVSVAKTHNLAKENDLIIVTTGTTDKIDNVMKICQVD